MTFQRKCTSQLAQYTMSPSPRPPCSLGWTDDTAPGHPFSFLGACPALLLSQKPVLSRMAVFIHLCTRLPTKAMNFLGATLGARVPAPSSQHLVRTCPLPLPHSAHPQPPSSTQKDWAVVGVGGVRWCGGVKKVSKPRSHSSLSFPRIGRQAL